MATTTTAPSSLWEMLKTPDPEPARRWLRWHPSEIDACIEARGKALPKPLEPKEIEEITEFHRRCGADEASLAQIEKLGPADARVVVTGQQPGILAGPLYSIYKAIGAVKLARELGSRHPNLNFVPVFWVASEDHDFAEVRRAIWPGSRGEIIEMLIENPDFLPGRMIGTLRCHELGEMLCVQIKESTWETEFRRDVLQLLSEAYAPHNTWEEAFARVFLRLLAGSGIVLVSPLMNWVRRRAVPVLERELETACESSAVVIERGEELKRAGLEPEIHRHSDALNFFFVDERHCRHALRLRDGAIVLAGNGGEAAEAKETPLAASVAELADRIRQSPAAFSTNVVTRPMVQDTALPTVAQLVGPGEAAYFAQVESVYENFGVFAPVRFPRPRAVLIQKNIQRTLEKYNLTAQEALESDGLRLAKNVLERDLSAGVVGEVRAMHERHASELRALAAKLGDNKSVTSAIDKLLHAMDKGYDTLQDRILYAQQEDQAHLNQAMLRIEHSLNPSSKPQERVLNPIVPFAVNYGLGWVGELIKRLDPDPAAPLQKLAMAEFESQH